MAFVRFEQLLVKMSVGAEEGAVFAQNASVSENLPLTPVRSLGMNGAVSTTATGPMDGSWSLTFIPSSRSGRADAGACKPSDKDRVGSDSFMKKLLNAPKQSFTSTPLKMNWRGTKDQILFAKGAATTFSMSLEPNNLITASIDGNFYDDAGIGGPGGGGPKAPFFTSIEGSVGAQYDAGGGTAVAHSSQSGPTDVTDLGFSTNPFNVSYSATRGLNPIYTLNKLEPAFVMPTDPQESISMQGDNLPKGCINSVAKPLCIESIDLSFAINDVCEVEIFSATDLAVCGYVQSSDIAVATDDVLRGNITVIDYNYEQNF